jgi:hypothetical protein
MFVQKEAPMMRRLIYVLTVLVGAVAAVVLAGCGGAAASEESWGLGQEEIASKVPITLPGRGVAMQELTVRIVGPSHTRDEASPANFAVRPDLPVRVTIYNYTRQVHTFHSPGLGLAKIVLAGAPDTPRKLSFAFTPGRRGVFHWLCVPCNEEDHFMGGSVYAIIRV